MNLHVLPDVWPIHDLVTHEAELHVVLVGANGFLVVQVRNLTNSEFLV